MVMKPEGRSRLRVAVLERKRLPDARDHERIWGFIEAVKVGPAVEDEFREHHYATKTRGERTLPTRPKTPVIYPTLMSSRSAAARCCARHCATSSLSLRQVLQSMRR
jgi:hypothetical protein